MTEYEKPRLLEPTMTKLLPCPFCGSPATIDVMRIEPGWWGATAFCDGIADHVCSAQMICGGDTMEQATEAVIAAWNRRGTA